MTVKVGDIVLYFNGGSSGGFDAYNGVPAIVTRVHSGKMLNLTILPDGAPPICKGGIHHESQKGDLPRYWRERS